VFSSKISTLITVNYKQLFDSFLVMQKMCLAKSTAQSHVLQHCALIGVDQLNYFAVNQHHMTWCFPFSWLSDIFMELFVWCFFNMWPFRQKTGILKQTSPIYCTFFIYTAWALNNFYTYHSRTQQNWMSCFVLIILKSHVKFT
jgi:hypothetical protein